MCVWTSHVIGSWQNDVNFKELTMFHTLRWTDGELRQPPSKLLCPVPLRRRVQPWRMLVQRRLPMEKQPMHWKRRRWDLSATRRKCPWGASIKCICAKGEGVSKKCPIFAYDSTDRLREKRTRGGGGQKSRKICKRT